MVGVQGRKPVPGQRPSQGMNDMGDGKWARMSPELNPSIRRNQDSNVVGNGPYPRRNPELAQGTTHTQSRTPLPQGNRRALFEGYGKDVANEFRGEKPQNSPMNNTRPQSSTLVDINDPIQVHLLVETALGDSKEFEILSPEEVDELKRKMRLIRQRIDQTRQNLAIQSKYRDAAISMAKLYSNTDRNRNSDSPDGKQKSRRSLLGNRSSNGEQVKEAEMERIASERKCEELAQELFNLEKNLMEPQKKLLEHTAGILQMTHKGPATGPKIPGHQQAIPGSPESLYTYSNARSSIEPLVEDDIFDERSLYRMFDRIDGSAGGGQRDSWGLQGGLTNAGGQSREQTADQIRMITSTEQRLEQLNNRLREVIVKASPKRQDYGMPPTRAPTNEVTATPGKTIMGHLDYLEQGISAIDSDQSREKATQRSADNEIEEALEGINGELWTLILAYDSTRPQPPRLTGKSIKTQLTYLQQSLAAVDDELKRAKSEGSKNLEAQRDNLDQVEAVLTGLWDILQSGDDRAKNGTTEDGRDVSNAPVEPFSIQAFSTKVQQMFSQITGLKEQKNVLQRQIKQQRELNNKSDSEKDSQLAQLEANLQHTQHSQEKAEKEAKDMQIQLTTVMERLNEARRESTQRALEKKRREDGESAAIQTLEVKLSQRNDEIIRLEEDLQELKSDRGKKNAEVQARLAEAGAKVEAIQSQLKAAEQGAASWKKQMDDKEAELEHSNMEIARLQTEVTIARAELDGAYGSRAQRAAEVAANPAIQREIDNLTTRNTNLQKEVDSLRINGGSGGAVAELKRELSETIEDYEQMTKASIEWEKEREALEREVDKLRDEREILETRLADEQVRWLGMRSPGGGATGGHGGDGQGVGAGNTSTTVLKNEFKKMMRDTRAENAKALRSEQTERRRLEDELRALKKLQGPGKSSLSQSVVES